MKISTNPVGNYNIHRLKVNSSVKKTTGSKSEFQLDEIGINKNEKKFFSKLYPSQKEKIMKYHFYDSKGKYSGVAIGNNIDLRG